MLAGNDGCRGETWGGGEVSGAGRERQAPQGQCEGPVAQGQVQLPPPGSPTLTCCIGQVVLRWQQRVAEVVVVVMR